MERRRWTCIRQPDRQETRGARFAGARRGGRRRGGRCGASAGLPHGAYAFCDLARPGVGRHHDERGRAPQARRLRGLHCDAPRGRRQLPRARRGEPHGSARRACRHHRQRRVGLRDPRRIREGGHHACRTVTSRHGFRIPSRLPRRRRAQDLHRPVRSRGARRRTHVRHARTGIRRRGAHQRQHDARPYGRRHRRVHAPG